MLRLQTLGVLQNVERRIDCRPHTQENEILSEGDGNDCGSGDRNQREKIAAIEDDCSFENLSEV